MKKILSAAMIAVLVLACGFCMFGCGSKSSDTSDSGSSSSNESSQESASDDEADSNDSADDTSDSESTESTGDYSSGIHHAVVLVDGYDAFTIKLNADDAPITVQNFCDLANSGFYNGLTFHRIVEGFCLQGGDPEGNGTGGSSETIKGEFSGNNVDNPLADDFQKGTVAMARSSENDSASSQFFITLDTSSSVSSSLNGQYAAFGTIGDNGMKIVDQIVSDYAANATGTSGAIDDASKQPVIKSITIID